MINKLIKKRKSIRRYDPNGIVSKQQIELLLEAAMHAPSACNTRPWEFVVVQDRTLLSQIVAFHNHAQMLKTAQLAIVVLGKPQTQKTLPANGMWQQDCGAATQNILLQAADLNLGTCWCGIYPVEKYVAAMQQLLKLPKESVPFCVIAVGVPAEEFGGSGFYQPDKVTWL